MPIFGTSPAPGVDTAADELRAPRTWKNRSSLCQLNQSTECPVQSFLSSSMEGDFTTSLGRPYHFLTIFSMKKILPNVQPEASLVQLEAMTSGPVACYLGKRPLHNLVTVSLQVDNSQIICKYVLEHTCGEQIIRTLHWVWYFHTPGLLRFHSRSQSDALSSPVLSSFAQGCQAPKSWITEYMSVKRNTYTRWVISYQGDAWSGRVIYSF